MLSGLASNDIISSLISLSSRYRNLDTAEYDGKRCLNVPDPIGIKPSLDNPDNTIVITGRFVNRLDLVSLKFYSTPRYWWILAYYNNMENPFALPHGTVLKVPSYSTLLLNGIIR